MDLVIHKALVEEAYEFAVCHTNCWRDAYKGIMPDAYLENMLNTLDEKAEKFKQWISDASGSEVCGVTLDGKMIGKLGFGECRDEDKTNTGEIIAIYLLKEYWDKGYGRQMMEYTMEKLKEMGFQEIVIWVLEENIRARLFYEKFGFAFDGAIKEINLSETLIEMRYSLVLS